MNLIILGAPGAGKGTQAEVICNKYNIPAISTGNILRAAMKAGTPIGQKAKDLIDNGNFVPDEFVIELLKERLAKSDCDKGYILDGFPRTITQAHALDKMGVVIDKVIEIYVSDEDIKKRISGRRVCEVCGSSFHIEYRPSKVENVCDNCGGKTVTRKDDLPETVVSRLGIYHEITEPIKEYYKNQGKLITVIGQEEIAETSKLTLAAVEG